MNLKTISTALGIAVIAAAAIGAAYKYDQNVIKRCEFELLSQRLEQKIVNDRINNLMDKIIKLELEYGGEGVPLAPVSIKEIYKKLLSELEMEKENQNK